VKTRLTVPSVGRVSTCRQSWADTSKRHIQGWAHLQPVMQLLRGLQHLAALIAYSALRRVALRLELTRRLVRRRSRRRRPLTRVLDLGVRLEEDNIRTTKYESDRNESVNRCKIFSAVVWQHMPRRGLRQQTWCRRRACNLGMQGTATAKSRGCTLSAVTWHTHKGYEVLKRHLLRRLLRRRAGGRLDLCALCRRVPSLRRRRQRRLERCLPAGGRAQLLSRNMTLFMRFDLA